MRRLLLRQRLYGIKVGTVWAIFPDDLEAFKRTRRPPGRPRLQIELALDRKSTARIGKERKAAGTVRLLRRRPKVPQSGRKTSE